MSVLNVGASAEHLIGAGTVQLAPDPNPPSEGGHNLFRETEFTSNAAE